MPTVGALTLVYILKHFGSDSIDRSADAGCLEVRVWPADDRVFGNLRRGPHLVLPLSTLLLRVDAIVGLILGYRLLHRGWERLSAAALFF